MALEPQKLARDPHQARLYFVREKGYYGMGAAPRIKVDGEPVGSVANGSYISVDRPPGQHTIRVEPPIALGYFEADVQVAAGRTYYYEVGPDPIMPAEAIYPHMANNVGRPMNGRGFPGGWRFNLMDAGAGAAELAKLKAQ